MKIDKPTISLEDIAEVTTWAQRHLGDEWEFEVQDGKKNVYGFPDLERKRIILCKAALDKFGFVWGRRLALSMIATQLAVRSGGKANGPAVKKAYEIMGVRAIDRMPVRFK
jgi:hypothetical protein